jgi:uncharacterized protein (TIGR02391 family)
MLDLPPQTILELPLDELAMRVLADPVATRAWNEGNYLLEAQNGGISGDALNAVSEALEWLRARAMIAGDPRNASSHGAFIVTRTGRRALEEGGLHAIVVTSRLDGLHPLIEKKAQPQFLLGEYEQGVFASMKAVEVRVRKLGSFGDDVIGVDLMNKAFGPNGPLTDSTAQKGEQEGTRALFAGSYAVFRNPAGHREVDYDDVGEAAEAVQTASMLMRILDRIEARL